MTTSPDRERVIRAAWAERGKAEWNPSTHGRGLLSLHIPASVEMRPVRFGAPLPRYDDLEFHLARSTMNGQPVHSIVCEDVVVETIPPEHAPPGLGMAEIVRAEIQGAASPPVIFADKEAVDGWLKAQTDDAAVVFAARAALRVLPALTFSRWPGTGRRTTEEIILRVFRAVDAAWAVAAYPGQRNALNKSARAALRGLSDLQAPPPTRAAAYASATAAGQPGTISRASTAVGYALDSAGSQGRIAFEFLLTALSADAELLNDRFSTVTVANSQLWPGSVPEWVLASWGELRSSLLDADHSWEVWTGWYEERLNGYTTNQAIEVAIATIDDSVWDQKPAEVNARIKGLIESGHPPEVEIFEDPASDFVEIFGYATSGVADDLSEESDADAASQLAPEPPSGPGPQYRPRNGKLSEVASVPASDEVARQISLHRLIRRDAAALAASITLAANSYPELARTAGEYSRLLSNETTNVDVAGLWSVGGALSSFAQAYREQNSARTLSDPLEPHLHALLQTVVRQHGAFILGFEEGRELVSRADEFAVDALRLSEIAAPGTVLLNELTDNRALVDDRTRELHEPVRDRIIEIGWASSRISYSAYLVVRNSVRAMIKYTVGEHPNAGAIIGLLTATSVALGDPNSEFIRAAVPVLQQYSSQLLAFFSHSPEMRAYVEWALQILQADHDRA